MPMTLNVGLSRKVGEANYGSRGASINLEVEVESALVREPDELRDKIRYLFRLANDAIAEELTGRRATVSQLRAIQAIASRREVDLATLLRESYGAKKPADLSMSDASRLIDELKSLRNGTASH